MTDGLANSYPPDRLRGLKGGYGGKPLLNQDRGAFQKFVMFFPFIRGHLSPSPLGGLSPWRCVLTLSGRDQGGW